MTNRLRGLLAALAAISILHFPSSMLYAAPGDLDSTLAGTGKIRFASFGGGYAIANAVAIEPADGKLILAGFGNGRYNYPNGSANGGDFLIARLDTSNELDTTFGDGGKVVTQVSTNYPVYNSSAIQAVAVQADGKIVAAGYSYQNPNYTSFTLVRYNPNGSLDTSFGSNGIVFTDFNQQSQINAMLIESDSNIVVAGSIGGQAGFVLARYTPSGALDNSFGILGAVTTSGTGYAAHAIMEADGAIYAVGTAGSLSTTSFAVFRYTTNGVLDSTFGGTGKVITQVPAGVDVSSESGNAVGLQLGIMGVTANLIVVAGTTAYDDNGFHALQTVIRYNENGTLDTSFGSGGFVTNAIIPATGIDQSCSSLIVQGFVSQPRKITIGGYGTDGTNVYYSIARFTATGALDTTFGSNSSGKTLLSVGRSVDDVEGAEFGMVVQPGGDFVLAGYRGLFQSEFDFAAARFTSSGLVDTTFGSNGIVLAAVSDEPGGQGTGVAVQPDGKIVVAGDAPPFYSLSENLEQVRFALLRFNSDGSLDNTFGLKGKVMTFISTNSVSAGPIAIQPDGKIVGAGSVNFSPNILVVRYNPDGSLDNSFGSGGFTILTPPNLSGAAGIGIQTNGEIVVGTSGNNTSQLLFGVVRLTAGGVLDSSFGSGGVASAPIGTSQGGAAGGAFGMGIQSDGKILVSGLVAVGLTTEMGLVRFNSDGSLDNSFGTQGRTGAGFGSGNFALGTPALAIQPDGKILVGGQAAIPSIIGFLDDFGIVRFTTNGSLDMTFGDGGEVITPVGDSVQEQDNGVVSLVLQASGKIVAAGIASDGTNDQYAVLRYNPDGSLDTSYGSAGATIVDFADGGNDKAAALALDSAGRAVVAGNANGSFGLVRLLGDVLPISLMISLTATNTAVVSWPYPSSGWGLQQNSDLINGSWVTPPETVNNDGTNNFINISPPTGNLFFRLKE